MLLLLACVDPLGAPPADDSGTRDTAEAWTGPVAPASGVAVEFTLGGGAVVGAEVATLELSDARGVTAGDGTFSLDAPAGGEGTFTLSAAGLPPIQTGTLDVPEAGISGVTFQVPDQEMYGLMAAFSGVTPDPASCQIATTVTCLGCDMWHGAFHGEPGATVTIEPAVAAGHGPVYFARNSENGVIYPDPDLTSTSDDGGVLFLNVPPGRYMLRAQKAGLLFDSRVMRCREGWLVNASPPYGLNVIGAE